jgi:hypothetical protein
MNIHELNNRSAAFTQSILQKVKIEQPQEEVEEVTTSLTDTNQTFDLDKIPKKNEISY